jgi:hypothetical protein
LTPGNQVEFAIIGIAVFFNIAIIKWKFDRARYADAILDMLLLTAVTIVFSGTFGGLVVGTIASAMVSMYLIASPPTYFNGIYQKFIERSKRRRRY